MNDKERLLPDLFGEFLISDDDILELKRLYGRVARSLGHKDVSPELSRVFRDPLTGRIETIPPSDRVRLSSVEMLIKLSRLELRGKAPAVSRPNVGLAAALAGWALGDIHDRITPSFSDDSRQLVMNLTSRINDRMDRAITGNTDSNTVHESLKLAHALLHPVTHDM